MRKCLLVALAGLACSKHGSEQPVVTTRLPSDLPVPAIVRQASGRITGQDGGPVAGALVSVIDLRSFRGVGFAVSDHAGRFAIGLPGEPVVVTATADGHVVGLLVSTAGDRLSLVLTKPSGMTRRFSGIVVNTKGQPLSQVRVRLMNWSWPTGAAFYTTSDDAGVFQFSVDAPGSYDLTVDDSRYVSDFAPSPQRWGDRARLTAYERDWITKEASLVDETALRELCVPLRKDGVRRLAALLRGATAVGLGEATHGTHEFTELRSRLIEELSHNGWLTTIALEASWAEVARVDDYVRRRKGTAREAVASLAYWPWRTEEFVALVEAVRSRNDELPADKKIEMLGIDYAPPEATADFLRLAFPGADVLAALEPLRHIVSWLETSKLSTNERENLVRALKELARVAERQSPVSVLELQGIGITQQIVEGRDDEFRDRVMADAILALLARSDRTRRVAIWAHNQHVAEGPVEGAVPMGHHLKARLADKYRAIGTAFYQGSFRTYSGLEEKMVNHAATPPPPFYFESAMYRVSPSIACALDVTAATRHPGLREWIAAPKHVRNYGGLEISESYPWPPVVVTDLWSGVIFVPSTTPTTPLD